MQPPRALQRYPLTSVDLETSWSYFYTGYTIKGSSLRWQIFRELKSLPDFKGKEFLNSMLSVTLIPCHPICFFFFFNNFNSVTFILFY